MPDLPIRVAVISRHLIIRAGLVHLIAQLHERAVVTEATSAARHLDHHDVAIYDLGAADAGADAELQQLIDSNAPVIALVHDRTRDSLPADVAATAQVITLSVTPEQLLETLQRTTPPRSQRHGDPEELQLPAGLTDREFRVIELIGEGLSNKQIAAELCVAVNTVKTYIRTAYRKLGVNGRSAAILWAIEHGLAGGRTGR